MPAADELTRLTATEAVTLLKRREISPVELVDAAAARIEAVDGQVNALPIRFFEQARTAAKRLSATTAKDSARPGWLAGLPIAVKDYNDVAGQITTYGSPIFANSVAETSDLTVQTLVAHGAIPIAKSNVPEFAGSNTFNKVFGATRTPWDTRLTSGGSSGGSAAALASGQVWLATGNDLGGSLRIPASYCGIVGMRPSVGRVPRPISSLPFDPLWVEGPMGRTVADVALMLDAQAWPSRHDPLSLPRPETPFAAAITEPKFPRRVGFTPDLGLSRAVDPEVVEICRAGARKLEEVGVQVEEGGPDLSGGIETFQTLRALLFSALRGDLLETHRDQIAPEIVWNLEKGLALETDEILRAERQRAILCRKVSAYFDGFDMLACPTVALPPFPVEQRYPTEIDGEKLTTYIDWMFLTFVITLTGCPAISVPCGVTRTGLPVGLQLIGRPRGDFELISAARLLEQGCGIARQVPLTPRAP
ncbi:amidase family protein [Rhodospirillaceae bacterium SYSU D60014]|uniref:amidase n=1 Tax=Virgifigura deserti TaxID=2268457 RepID=UPI000E6644B3